MNKKSRSNKPTALILHGANFLGSKLIELLSTQNTNIVVADEFNKSSKKYLKEFKNKYDAQTYDLSGIPSLDDDLNRVDYIFILLDQFMLSHRDISSKTYMSETNILGAVFKLAVENSSKVTLASSISHHRKLVNTKTQEYDDLSEAKNKNPYSIAEMQRYAENLSAEYHDKAGLDVRICRLGEVIGKDMPLESNTTFVDMVKESITKPRITIPGEGLDYAYYIHSLDAVYGLIKATFSSKTRGGIFTLALPDEISTLNLAYRILELNPKANEIEFSETDEETGPQKSYVPAKNLKKIGWTPKVEFEKALVETIQYFYDEYNLNWKDKPTGLKEKKKEQEEKEEEVKKITPRSEKITPLGKILFSIADPIKSAFNTLSDFLTNLNPLNVKPKVILKNLGIAIGFIILYILIIAPVFQLTAGAGFTYYYGKQGYQQAYNLQTQQAENNLSKASYFAEVMNTGWHGLRWIRIIPGLKNFYNETSQITDGVEHLAASGHELAQGIHPYVSYFQELDPTTSFNDTTGGSSRTYQDELEEMESGVGHINQASIQISLAEESLSELSTDTYPKFVRPYISEIQDKTKQLEATVNQANDFAYFLPEILGIDGRKTYVVLFQNPMELRSTGGWLTSYALVGIEYGQIRNLTVEDVYTLDGQIDEAVEPPVSMQEALDVDDWTLSLSNWSPDFPQSAEAAEYFLQLEEQIVKADGVIAIDLNYVSELIDIWGEISVPGESETVTKENIYEKVVEIHKGFTPGSTDKPVFLSNLANQILLKLVEEGKSNWPQVAETTVNALDQKHMLIYIKNNSVSKALNNANWDGRLEEKTNIIYPVEWNWGGNKANHFVNRSLFLDTSIIDENTIQQKLIITYQNSSETNTYPEGDYENFMRIYMPENSEIIRVEGIENSQLNQSAYGSFLELSGWVYVPAKSRRTVSITYSIKREDVDSFPLEILADDQIKYSANIVKQPGTDEDPITVEVSYPDNWEPLDLDGIRRELNSLIKRSQLDTDQNITITWEK